MPGSPRQVEKLAKVRQRPTKVPSRSAISTSKAGWSPKPYLRISADVEVILSASPIARAIARSPAWIRSESPTSATLIVRSPAMSECHPVAALQAEHSARLVRCRDLQRQAFENAPYAADLLGVGFGELAAIVEAVFQPDADAATQRRGHSDHGHLMAAGGEHREAVVVAEQLVGDA